MTLADQFNAAIEAALGGNRREIPATKCLKLAYRIDRNFRYEPADENEPGFLLTFGDGSSVWLDD